uniref:Serpin domain-containing protein n=2 Tax=Stomoxys calcitrans TaxID=35570 RepID=A0A1I8PD87_STOCA
MRINVKFPSILTIITIHLSCLAANDTAFHISLNNFSRRIFSQVAKSNAYENIIMSPFSVETCLAMARIGAVGETASQMDRILNVSIQNPLSIADKFHTVLTKYKNSKVLSIANRVYVMEGNELSDEYKHILSQKFLSTAEDIDFSDAENASDTINTWVATQTNDSITDLVSPYDLDEDIRLFLLSAISFNGQWANGFPKEYTEEDDFYIDDSNPVKVQMMQVKSKFQVGDLSELKASAILLPYKDCDLSMLIVLPDATDGLEKLLHRLKAIDLSSLVKRKINRKIKAEVRMPKFKAEFKIELSDTLKEMGMEKIFSNADFGRMLKAPEPLSISQIVHQATIEVSEEGTKAAAITAANPYLRSAFSVYSFYVDHPFYYAVINNDNVPMFEGTYFGP